MPYSVWCVHYVYTFLAVCVHLVIICLWYTACTASSWSVLCDWWWSHANQQVSYHCTSA